VGTCNGLLCLCDNAKLPGGAITLVNPATGEVLSVPPLPCAGLFDGMSGPNWWVYMPWNQAYTFGYHPISGKYKVVHVPSRFRNDGEYCEFDTVQVLTLGEASWREVLAGHEGGATCERVAGIISVDGTAYWTTEGSATRVMAFDLEHEHVTSLPLPPRPEWPSFYPLTEVHGRVGILVSRGGGSMTTDVWVLEKGRRWSRRYSLRQRLPRPHFVFGEYVLTREESLYARYMRKGPLSYSDVVRGGHQDQKRLVAMNNYGYAHHFPKGTFAYVKTTESLSGYTTN
jgi:F-box interacting protein